MRRHSLCNSVSAAVIGASLLGLAGAASAQGPATRYAVHLGSTTPVTDGVAGALVISVLTNSASCGRVTPSSASASKAEPAKAAYSAALRLAVASMSGASTAFMPTTW